MVAADLRAVEPTDQSQMSLAFEYFALIGVAVLDLDVFGQEACLERP